MVVYGNDDGLIAERAATLARTVCEDLKDPFRVVDIAGDVLKGDPARLADEFGAMSLMGGRRVIRVRPAGEESAAALENLAAAVGRRRADRARGRQPDAALQPAHAGRDRRLPGGVALLHRQRGGPRSGWSRAPRARAGLRASKRMRSTGSSSGWAAIAARAAARSTSSCSTRKATAARPSRSTTPLAVLGDTAADRTSTTSSPPPSTASSIALDRALDRVFAEGGNPVQLVRALQRHADQLHLVAGHVAKGGNLEAAMFKARGLPRGGPVRQRFERHLRAWPLTAAQPRAEAHPRGRDRVQEHRPARRSDRPPALSRGWPRLRPTRKARVSGVSPSCRPRVLSGTAACSVRIRKVKLSSM